MALSDDAKKQLNRLLSDEEEKYLDSIARWEELDPKTHLGVQNIADFHLGYIFGSIEEKFVKWYYSMYGVAQSDEEYEEFWNICKSKLKDLKNLK